MELLVNDSMGWTPIMIKTIINEALIHAHQNGREFLTYKDWLSAADERALGLKQPIRSWNLTDRRETAYHEAGHAVAAHYLQPENRISKATIIRRGHALGFVQQQPREERTSLLRPLDRVAASWSSLAGSCRSRAGSSTRSRPGRRRDLGRRRPRPRPTSAPGDGPDQARHADRRPAPRRRAGARWAPTSCSTSCTRRPSGCSARRSRRCTTWRGR